MELKNIASLFLVWFSKKYKYQANISTERQIFRLPLFWELSLLILQLLNFVPTLSWISDPWFFLRQLFELVELVFVSLLSLAWKIGSNWHFQKYARKSNKPTGYVFLNRQYFLRDIKSLIWWTITFKVKYVVKAFFTSFLLIINDNDGIDVLNLIKIFAFLPILTVYNNDATSKQ